MTTASAAGATRDFAAVRTASSSEVPGAGASRSLCWSRVMPLSVETISRMTPRKILRSRIQRLADTAERQSFYANDIRGDVRCSGFPQKPIRPSVYRVRT